MNFELFKDAIAVIAGIPDDRVNLDNWQDTDMSGREVIKKPKKITCGTVACAGGWLALNPQMRRRGLRVDSDGSPMLKDGGPSQDAFRVLARFFGITVEEATKLFTYRQSGTGGSRTDRQVWLKRAHKLLAKYEETMY